MFILNSDNIWELRRHIKLLLRAQRSWKYPKYWFKYTDIYVNENFVLCWWIYLLVPFCNDGQGRLWSDMHICAGLIRAFVVHVRSAFISWRSSQVGAWRSILAYLSRRVEYKAATGAWNVILWYHFFLWFHHMVRSLSLTSVRVSYEPPGRHVAHLYAEKLKMINQDINCR